MRKLFLLLACAVLVSHEASAQENRKGEIYVGYGMYMKGDSISMFDREKGLFDVLWENNDVWIVAAFAQRPDSTSSINDGMAGAEAGMKRLLYLRLHHPSYLKKARQATVGKGWMLNDPGFYHPSDPSFHPPCHTLYLAPRRRNGSFYTMAKCIVQRKDFTTR